MPSYIIVGFVRQILRRVGQKAPHPHPRAVLKKPTLNRVKDLIGTAEQNFGINFTKAKANFCLGLNYNDDNSCLFVIGKNICKFKTD